MKCRYFAIGIALLLIVTARAAQNDSVQEIVAPPRKDLGSVHLPDLTQLEVSVREQLTRSQLELVGVAKDPTVTEARLGEAYGTLGQIYQAYSLNSPARECYRNASLLTPKDFRWFYLLGTIDRLEGRYVDATANYRRVLTLRPDYVPALVNLGNILLEENRLEDAVVAFSAALKIEDMTPAAHYGLGQVAMSQRKYSEAVQELEKTLAQLPDANRVHYSLAMAYRGLGNLQKAEEHLTQQGSVGVRVMDPLVDGLQDLVSGESLLMARASKAIEAQRFEEAAVELRKIVRLKPDNVTARINLGVVLNRVGDQLGAVEQFEAAIRLEPKRVNAHYNLAVLLADQGKHEEAIGHLQSILRLMPGDNKARSLLATELAKSGRNDEALVELTRVVQEDPGNEAALLEQVKLLHRKGNFSQAVGVLSRSYAQYPTRGHTALLLAYLLVTSPEYQLRNGTKGLELAKLLYEASGKARQGALVTLALAELGRCSEAGEWQRGMISAAEESGDKKSADRLNETLKLYDQLQTCRPVGDAQLSELSFYELPP